MLHLTVHRSRGPVPPRGCGRRGPLPRNVCREADPRPPPTPGLVPPDYLLRAKRPSVSVRLGHQNETQEENSKDKMKRYLLSW